MPKYNKKVVEDIGPYQKMENKMSFQKQFKKCQKNRLRKRKELKRQI